MVDNGKTETTVLISEKLNVRRRLRELHAWYNEWEEEDKPLEKIIDDTDESKPLEKQRALHASTLRAQKKLILAKHPIEISADSSAELGYGEVFDSLAQQFAQLSRSEKKRWLQTLHFILTPSLRDLYDKLNRVREYRAFGQARNFLLGGQSGTGKSTCLDWLLYNHLPEIEAEANRVPIIKVDAPQSSRNKKQLLSQLVLRCGATFAPRTPDYELLDSLELLVQKCRVELVIIDELEQLKTHDSRRHLLEISNRINKVRGIPIVGASCNPIAFTYDDAEIAGRWNDYVELRQYTGKDLDALLIFVELLIPFSQRSFLSKRQVEDEKGQMISGPAEFIEHNTHGILRDIMILILDASTLAIERGKSRLTMELLTESWIRVKNRQVDDTVKMLRKAYATD